MRQVPLTKQDRCDRCPAEARFLAELPFGDLMFCVNHGLKFRDALEDQGAELFEKRR